MNKDTLPPTSRKDLIAMVDAAMVEMANIAPPLRRNECERLICAAIAAQSAVKESLTPQQAQGVPKFNTSKAGRDQVARFFSEYLRRHDFTDYIKNALAADFACALAPTLYAVQAAPQAEPVKPQGVPASVPRIATPEMRARFREAYREGGFWTDRLDYALDQMLTAAPQAEPQPKPKQGKCCYGGIKPKSACSSCGAWTPIATSQHKPPCDKQAAFEAWLENHPIQIVEDDYEQCFDAFQAGINAASAEPQQAEPLSDEQANSLFLQDSSVDFDDSVKDAYKAGIRAAEQAHGIGTKGGKTS